MGRSFVSPEGAGVYLSVLLKPRAPLSDFRCITAMTAVAAADAVEKVSGLRPAVKWPNDLVLQRKKIAGILTEMSLEGETGALQYMVVGFLTGVLWGALSISPMVKMNKAIADGDQYEAWRNAKKIRMFALIGIGVNVHERKEDFPEEIRMIAGSIRSEGGVTVRRAELAASLLNAFGSIYGDLPAHQKSSHERYLNDCLNLGKKVLIVRDGAEREAEAVSVDEDFGLVVRYADGTEETIRTGEVSIRGLYGYT